MGGPPAPPIDVLAEPDMVKEGLLLEERGDTTAALRLFEAACLEGKPAGCYLFEGGLRTEGKRGTPLPARAAEAENACEGGAPGACFELAMMFDDDDGEPRDGKRAFNLFERACHAGHLYACYRQALIYLISDEPAASALALRLVMKACDGGFGAPCQLAAKMLDSGSEVALANTPNALRERACRRGSIDACVALIGAAPERIFACDQCSTLPEDDPRCVDCAMWRRYEQHCCEMCPERTTHAACGDMDLVTKHPQKAPPAPPRKARSPALDAAIAILKPLCDRGISDACADWQKIRSDR